MNDLEILLADGNTQSEAAKRMRDHSYTIYTVDEYLEWFDQYTDDFEQEDKDFLRNFLLSGIDGHIWFGDASLLTYSGVKYFIEYCN